MQHRPRQISEGRGAIAAGCGDRGVPRPKTEGRDPLSISRQRGHHPGRILTPCSDSFAKPVGRCLRALTLPPTRQGTIRRNTNPAWVSRISAGHHSRVITVARDARIGIQQARVQVPLPEVNDLG